ncbi:hypothetical protein N8878_04455 [Psychromonas sp.]|nr:hypothetical protein [Psychromonas sp.]
MLVFYIICGCIVFALSGLLMQLTRIAIYRRRIIRHLSATPPHNSSSKPFVLSVTQEKQIKQCFLKGVSIQECIETIQ